MFRNNGKADSHFDLLANGTRIYFHLGFRFRLTFCFCFCSLNVNFIFKNEHSILVEENILLAKSR